MFHSLSSSRPCPPPGVRMIECHADLNNYKFLPTVAVGPRSINTGLSSDSSNFPGPRLPRRSSRSPGNSCEGCSALNCREAAAAAV